MRFALLVSALTAAANAIDTISVKGSKFFKENGNQFFVKGIAYQLLPDDPLIDSTQCKLDSALMKTLGANSIRVYHVDPSANHDDCMKTFAEAGIYLWLDLDTFNSRIEELPKWNQTQLEHFGAVMDAFHKYDNTAGFFVGNEVITSPNGSVAAPYVKAAARDMKAYRDKKKYRKIPVGYSAADIATLRPMLQNYLACGDDPADALDFYSLNAYSWCGNSGFQQSGYDILIKNVTDVNYNIPIFFSETGCIVPKPRDWADQESIFGPDMTENWSGAIVYEWINENNGYGIVTYGGALDSTEPPDSRPYYGRSGTPEPMTPDFPNLSSRWKTLNPTGIKASNYKPTLKPVPCPASTSVFWQVDPKSPLPTLGQTYGVEGGSPSPTGEPNNESEADHVDSEGAADKPKPTSGSAAESPKGKGAAPTTSALDLQSMALGLVALLLGFCIWM